MSSESIESIRGAFERISAVRVEHVRKLVELSLGLCDPGRPAGPELRCELQALEQRCAFSPAGRAAFHDLLARLGVPTDLPIGLPLNDEPFWFRCGHPLANYQSRPALPESAEVVVIGAGLTGASAAYHLGTAPPGKTPRRFVVIDKADPAGEASGRNGGNFELIPENSVGVYQGIANERMGFLQRCYGGVPIQVLKAECERQASLVLGLALRNRDALRDIIERENIDCDFSPRGWLHLAHGEEAEQVICEEATLTAQHRHHFEIWPRRKILEEFGIKSDFLARFVSDDGTYHPFKYVCGMIGAALNAGVELYTRVRVGAVESVSADAQRVVTDRGTIVARRVIVATNAFTAELFPELGAIRPRQSQVMVTEHAPDRTRGRVVTTEDGPAFFSQPRDGTRDGRAPLLLGGGKDRPMENPSSRRRSPQVHALLLRLRDRFFPELHGQPPSAEWVGPMAFTPDQLPVIGFLRPGLIIAAGFNGYGGSYTTAAGQAAVHMALTGTAPDWVPEDVFSPRRLLVHQPLFMCEPDSLWRIAASLCVQLKAVSRRIAEAGIIGGAASGGKASPSPPLTTTVSGSLDPSRCSPARDDDARTLQTFAAFAQCSADELRELSALMRRWDLPPGTTVCSEGGPGGTCFLIVRGVVGVSIQVRGQQQLLVARLGPGSIFGQASLFGNGPRTATCTVQRDAVLLEIEREPCERVLRSRSPMAIKFMAALNEGLIAALRRVDRHLMRLNAGNRTVIRRTARA